MLQIERVMTELAANPAVGAIVMAVHSPGGTVTGTFELAQAIYEMRSQVRIVSVADSYMTSAAMAIGSAAHEVYSLPSGTVGSIGVIADLVSFARMYDRMGVDIRVLRSVPLKATANDMEPINEATVARLQELVDANHSQFVDAMAKQRGVSVAHVNRHFGNGDTLTAQRAVDVGMIDGIVRGGVDEVIAMVAGQLRRGRVA